MKTLCRFLFTFAVLTLALATASIPGQADTETKVRFRAGGDSASYSGRVRGDETARYVVDARGGQMMIVELRADNVGTYFNLLPAGTQQAIFIGSNEGNRFSGKLPRTGRYVIEVYLVRAAARRNEAANFTLDIAIPAAGSTAGMGAGNDYGDGDAGGPDAWMVSGVPAGDRLSVRASPSTSAALVGRLRNGEVVRNLGCRSTGGSRWCRIASAGAGVVHGWANGRFLVEAAGAGTAPDGYDDAGGADSKVRSVKCRDTAQDCIRKAESKCNGSFRTLHSESHAGGLLDDAVPGPVTWFALDYQCGYSDGRMPRFPFRGGRYEPEYGGDGYYPERDDYAVHMDERAMRNTCRAAAAMAFNKDTSRVDVSPIERTGGGYSAYGQYKHDGRINGFVCSFNDAGIFKHVYRQ
jgi:hypothetical protein